MLLAQLASLRPGRSCSCFIPIPTLSRCGHSAHAHGEVRQARVQSSMYDHTAHTPRPLVSLLPSASDLAQVTPLQFPNLLLLVCIPKHTVWACFGPGCDWNSAVSWPFPDIMLARSVHAFLPVPGTRKWRRAVLAVTLQAAGVLFQEGMPTPKLVHCI